MICSEAGQVSSHVDHREPEALWRRRPVAKPAMPDALWEATRTEVLGEGAFQHIPQPANYEQYQVCKP